MYIILRLTFITTSHKTLVDMEAVDEKRKHPRPRIRFDNCNGFDIYHGLPAELYSVCSVLLYVANQDHYCLVRHCTLRLTFTTISHKNLSKARYGSG